ncbi:general substrate transporter [Pisolithus orientalis]|uniref:general substrate transporter n=1 Tax=Pisolithus orientalis TaxID=936130 RepID=UPI0022255622|nr:general substrate transporter [Pisolithus orientalis]KAI6019734.1 general substrate transporter [Pisolithus orientalis]
MKSFTLYGWLVCAWVLTVSFQYGYHISALNQLQDVLTCRRIDTSTPVHYGLPTCILMNDATFSLVTSLFTLGGLCGSLLANIAMDRYGRKGATRISSVCNAVGALLSAVAASVTAIALGRFIVGFAAGVGICVGPIYLAETAHPNIRGNPCRSSGVGTQLAIVIGIMVTQVMGFGLATPKHWRLVLFISAALSIVQCFMSPVITESPVYLKRIGLPEQQKRALQRLWSDYIHRDSEELVDQPLLSNEEMPRPAVGNRATVTLPQLFRTPELRRPLFIAVFAMTSQQLSVLYYSNAILSRALPALAPYVSLVITVVNFLMTFPPIFLIERLGRKQLIQLSVAGAILSHLAVGYGLNTGMVAISSVAIAVFVMSFAIGLGPVPFVIIPEVAPSHVQLLLPSSTNHLSGIMNFVVGLVFLPLRNFLADGDPMKEGRVFYVFAVALLCSSLAFSKFYRR